MDGRKWMAVFGHQYNERKMDGRIWSSISFLPLFFRAFTACRYRHCHRRCHHRQLMSYRLLNQSQD